MLTEKKYLHPSAWGTDTVRFKEDIVWQLESRHIDALDNALNQVKLKETESIQQSDFPLDDIQDSIEEWVNIIQEERGIIFLKGFPIRRYSKDECEKIYWGLGTHLGEAQSQSLSGDRLGHVVDLGGKDSRYRAYQNSTELALHTDATDIVGMMCLVPAKQGGLSGYASGPAIYNELLEKDPQALATLCEGFHYHRFGEQAPGDSPVTEEKIPVFSMQDNYLSVSYLRSYIELAFGELQRDKTEAEQHALDQMDRVAHSSKFYCQFYLEPGDILFFSNYVVLHNRTEFFDDDDLEKRRHMLRLWLRAHKARPVNDRISPFGKRSGIKKQDGKQSFYTGETEYKEYAPPKQST